MHEFIIDFKQSKDIFVTSDHHFGHYNIIKYCNRGFENVEEMNDSLINAWNNKVSNDSIVFHCGDIAFCSPAELKNIVSRLNGKIYLMQGNHDKNIEEYKEFLDVVDDVVELRLKNIESTCKKIVLCHYPLMSWSASSKGALHLHGHTHNTLQYSNKAKDIGVDTNSKYEPYLLLDILNELDN